MNRWRQKLFHASMMLGLIWAFYHTFRNQGYEAAWYPLAPVMDFTAIPPFRHRVLMALLARGCQAVAPGLSVLYAYLLSQLAAIVLTMLALDAWSRLFVRPPLAILGPALAVTALAPTFYYFTFYDVAVVFFAAACLYCLFRGWLALYCVFFFIGTFNHEITLLLVLDGAAILWLSGMKPGRVAAFVAFNLLLYGLARGVLFGLLPVEAAWRPGKPAANLAILLHDHKEMFKVVMTLGCWMIPAALGWRHAPARLRAAALCHLPQLLVVNLLFGQINESRLFNSFLPLMLGLILCYFNAVLGEPPAGGSGS